MLLRNSELSAQNALLKKALESQQTKSSDLRNILCSMEIATLSIGPDLKLRFFTAAAGRLLGVSLVDVGATLSCGSPLEPEGRLMTQVSDVLRNGEPSERNIEMPSGQRCVCRLRPLHIFQVLKPSTDGVIITFVVDASCSDSLPIAEKTAHGGVTPNIAEMDGFLSHLSIDLAFGLTARQRQILGFVLAGHPSKNIAADLGISQRTVENHRAAIMQRTGATSLPALTRIALGASESGDQHRPLSSRMRDAVR